MYSNLCAVLANMTAVSDPKPARRLGHASIAVSIAGIFLGAIIVIVIVINASPAADTSPCTYYEINGLCYEHKTYYKPACSGVRRGDYCYY